MNNSQESHDTTNPTSTTITYELKKRVLRALDNYTSMENNLPPLCRSTQSAFPLVTRKAVPVADKVKFSTAQLMDLPNEVLTIILSRITPISVTAWLKLALTSKTFNTIVKSKTFYINHIGLTPEPSIALYLPNHKPHFWVLALVRHNELAQSEGKALFLALRLSTILYQPSLIHFGGVVSKQLKYLLVSGAAVLKCIARSARCRNAPSKASFEYSTHVLHNVLPGPVILLLRWVFYVIWLRLEKVDTKAIDIPMGQMRIHYGQLPHGRYTHAVDLQIASIAAHLNAQQHPLPGPGTGWTLPFTAYPRPASDLQRLLMVECGLLFGPSEGQFCWLLHSHHNMSGPMYWFLRDSKRRILYPGRSRGRFCNDGTRISFPRIGTTFDRRFNSLPNKLGLESPQHLDSREEFTRGIARQLMVCHEELFEMVQSVNFVRLGEKLRSVPFSKNTLSS